MDSSRDIVHNLAALTALSAVTVAATSETTVQTAAVDMAGFNAVMFALTPSRAIAEADAISYSFETSLDGTNWTPMNGLSDLPPRIKDEGNPLKVVVAPYEQTFGVFSHDRYVRVVFSGIADTTTVDLVVKPILRSDISEFVGWDPDPIPGDGED